MAAGTGKSGATALQIHLGTGWCHGWPVRWPVLWPVLARPPVRLLVARDHDERRVERVTRICARELVPHAPFLPIFPLLTFCLNDAHSPHAAATAVSAFVFGAFEMASLVKDREWERYEHSGGGMGCCPGTP